MDIMHGRSCMTTDPRIPKTPGRSTSGGSSEPNSFFLFLYHAPPGRYILCIYYDQEEHNLDESVKLG